MGWYGDYRSVSEVMAEKEFLIERTDQLQVVDTKETKTYGIILYKDTYNNDYAIDSFIFDDGMYKPIDFVDDFLVHFKRIPKSWHKVLSVNPKQKEIIDRQNQLIIEERLERENNKNMLDSMLVEGEVYSIWNGQFTAKYYGKVKRSHVFETDNGRLTRFTKLKYTELELAK